MSYAMKQAGSESPALGTDLFSEGDRVLGRLRRRDKW